MISARVINTINISIFRLLLNRISGPKLANHSVREEDLQLQGIKSHYRVQEWIYRAWACTCHTFDRVLRIVANRKEHKGFTQGSNNRHTGIREEHPCQPRQRIERHLNANPCFRASTPVCAGETSELLSFFSDS